MLKFLEQLDRRVAFLLMGLAVAIPILFPLPLSYKPSPLAQSAFDAIDRLPDGSKVVFSFDYDPASSGELQPMSNALVYHCARKRHKLYFMALWAPGKTICTETIATVLLKYRPDAAYGEDYVELGYQSGNEGVIKIAATDLRQQYKTDIKGTPLEAIPMMEGVNNLQAMDLLITISAGYPGSKEWVQYFSTPFPRTRMITGTTGVQSVSLYPYIPNQIAGMLGAIKGAAEYETIVNEQYPVNGKPVPELGEGQRRMGPQLVAHMLMVSLILLGNAIFFMQRKARREGRR
ncbi:MAG: hypothetical protein JNL80_12450 [Phycisphaerae bacterium]|jgi:hypothetical protein|nr:hypothetical protein [Phycisphaerae bacterium]